jgi:hypothetical protein
MRSSAREVGHAISDLYPIRKDEVVVLDPPAVFSIRHVTLPLGNGTTELIKINWEAGVVGCGVASRSSFKPFGAHQRPPAHVVK